MNSVLKKSVLSLAIASALGTHAANAACPAGTQPQNMSPITGAQFSALDTGFTNNTQTVANLNASGGTDANSLKITVDNLSRTQIKFNGSNQYFHGSNTGDANDLVDGAAVEDVYNEFGFYYQGHGSSNTGKGYYGPKKTTISSVWSNNKGADNDFITRSFSSVKGDGSAGSPYRVKIEYYADVNDDSAYTAADDILVTEIYTYQNNDKFVRRDRKIVKGSKITGALIPFDARDVVFNAGSDAGNGIYSLSGLTAVLDGDDTAHKMPPLSA